MQTRASTERTGFRDPWISEWHHATHDSLSMTDIDFLCIEMRYANPMALIEYKRMAPRDLVATAALRGVSSLANMAGIPSFIVFYQHAPPIFTVQPQNRLARFIVPTEMPMSEREYIEFLFSLRGERAPDWVLDGRSKARS